MLGGAIAQVWKLQVRLREGIAHDQSIVGHRRLESGLKFTAPVDVGVDKIRPDQRSVPLVVLFVCAPHGIIPVLHPGVGCAVTETFIKIYGLCRMTQSVSDHQGKPKYRLTVGVVAFCRPANSRVNGTASDSIPLILLLILASANLYSGPDVTYRLDILQRSLVGVAVVDDSIPAIPYTP